MTEHRRRVAAYAICLRDDQVLLTRFVAPDGVDRHWTLPGGGVAHAEDPYYAVVREVEEETGYQVEVERLLGVDSRSWPVASRVSGGAELHTVGVYYRARIVGGELRHEVDGSTDLAAWMSVTDVPGLVRAGLVDVGLELDRARPRTGHVDPVSLGGRIR